MGTTKYLVRTVLKFLVEMLLCCDSDEGPKKFQTTFGVTQGSIRDILLWNIMYNERYVSLAGSL